MNKEIKKETEYYNDENGTVKVTLTEPVEDENPNYYAIIPANVRYNNKLCANAKLLYGEITALSNKEGYCWASNGYFAKLYKTTTVTISRWVRQLKENNFITTSIEYKENTKEIEHRYIQITQPPITKMIRPINKNVGRGINKNVNTPINKNVKDNTTRYNTTSINNIDAEESASESKGLKSIYNDFMRKHYDQQHINKYIFAIPKERKQLSNLFKLFETTGDFEYFLNICESEKFVKDNGYVPSILIGQVSKIMLKKQQKKYNEIIDENHPLWVAGIDNN